jgi:diguanylate cyclase (GGDEF)-like protein
VAAHAWPPDAHFGGNDRLELAIPSLSGQIVDCLRERRPVVLDPSGRNRQLLLALGAERAAAVPVLSNGHLEGLIWSCEQADCGSLTADVLAALQQVAGELGIALARCRAFAMEREKAEFDALTRLHNRNAVNRFLDESFRDAERSDRQLALGLLDIDYFKGFNDEFGHQAGDDVLRIVADTMRGVTRPGDFLGRYGGEEFLFVLRDTDGQGALVCAERIRREIERRGQILIKRFPGHALTASIGVAVYDTEHRTPAQVIGAADQALYRAKEWGRNRVVSAWSSGEPQGRIARSA